jgi:hypothetical protein
MNIYTNKHVLRGSSHFTYVLAFRNADGGTTLLDGALNPVVSDPLEDMHKLVLRHQTPFVQENWIRIEVAIPNRGQYGNIVGGWIQDTVFFCATRELDHA